MTKIALITAFCYDDKLSNNNGRELLPGALADIYRIFKIVKECNYDKVHIISDLIIDNNSLYHVMSLINASPDIYSLRNITQYHDKEEYINLMIETFQAEKGFFYFSGHSLGSKLLLPGTDVINDTEIYQCLSKAKESNETFMIFDCCHGNNFMLPYIYDGNVYRLTHETAIYFKHKVISICASQSNEVSYSDVKGSTLTSSISELLGTEPPTLKIHDIFHSIVTSVASSTGSRPKIYATYPNIHYLWPWVVTNTNWNVTYDVYHGSITCQIR